MDLYESLGMISMECVWACGICVSSIVKVRTGIRHQPDPERLPGEADWVYRRLIMPLCMSSLQYIMVLLDGLLFGGDVGLSRHNSLSKHTKYKV